MTSVCMRSVKVGSASPASASRVQQIPLRHHRDVGVGLPQAPEVDEGHRAPGAHAEGGLVNLAVGQGCEPLPRPSSSSRRIVVGCTVSPRKSRRKSACFSSTVTSMPARANNSPGTIPAGPPPMIAHVVVSATVQR